MTLSQPHHPVLDQQFHLHTPLGGSGSAAVFRATHSTGQDAVVKLIYAKDKFFDELGRLYSLDSSPYFPSCLYNYPPASACDREIPLTLAGRELADRDSAEVGALVLEPANGVPLSQIMSELPDLEMVNVLLEMTYALRELAKRGIGHADLRPENVFLEREFSEIKIVDLGYYFGKHGDKTAGLSPEHATEHEPGPAADVYMFARHFLVPLRRKGRLRRLVRQCLKTDPAARPSLATIQLGLKQRRRSLLPKQSLEIIFGFLRPLNLAMWALIIFLGITFLPQIQGDKKVNWQQRRAKLLRKNNLPTAELVTELRALLPLSSGPDRERLIRDIADKTHDLDHVKILGAEDLAKPIAVFAFNANPLLIGRHEIYHLGDWVELEDSFGYIASIEYNRIQLVYESSLSWHVFDKPTFKVGQAFGNEVALVWNNEDNMNRLFEAIDQLDIPETIGLSRTRELLSENGRIAGLFVADTPGRVLQAIDELVLDDAGEELINFDQESRIPVYFKFMNIQFHDEDVSMLVPRLRTKLGCRVRLESALQSHKITTFCYNITWQRLLSELGIPWHVETDADGKILVLEGVEK